MAASSCKATATSCACPDHRLAAKERELEALHRGLRELISMWSVRAGMATAYFKREAFEECATELRGVVAARTDP